MMLLSSCIQSTMLLLLLRCQAKLLWALLPLAGVA
jgi:hypothetical protein